MPKARTPHSLGEYDYDTLLLEVKAGLRGAKIEFDEIYKEGEWENKFTALDVLRYIKQYYEYTGFATWLVTVYDDYEKNTSKKIRKALKQAFKELKYDKRYSEAIMMDLKKCNPELFE